MTYISAAVEGRLDQAVVEKLIAEAGAEIAEVYVKGGRSSLLTQLNGYHYAARLSPWIVLCDLDQDECAPAFVAEHLPRASNLQLRVAVRSVESWLLADPALARTLGVRQEQLPERPELEPRPKQTLIRLARNSTRRRIRADVGGNPAGVDPGSSYNELLINFVQNHWEPQRAAARSPSLRRVIAAVERLASA